MVLNLDFFDGGGIHEEVVSEADVAKPGQWHHVLWVWRSLWHRFYVDGRLAMAHETDVGVSDTAYASLSRMQPMSGEDAVLELKSGNGRIADLRFFRRALEASDAKTLAAAGVQDRLPEPAPMRMWVDWGLGTGRAVVYVDVAGLDERPARVLLTCVRADTGRKFIEAQMDSLPSGLGEIALQVVDDRSFEPGTYRFEADAYDARGKKVHEAASDDWIAIDFSKPWTDTQIGRSTEPKILPPYEPIRVEGNIVSPVLRDHVLAPTGLPRSIRADGEELMDGPVVLRVVSAGKTLTFDRGPGLGQIDNRGDAADWSSVTRTAQGHERRVDGHMEYDGVTRFDVTFAPKGAMAVDEVVLAVPYRDKTLRLLQAVADGQVRSFRAVDRAADGSYSARHIHRASGSPEKPERAQGVIFDANDLHHREGSYRFAPFVHVGNFDRGLSWFADNDQGWVHDWDNKPSMQLYATREARELRLNVVAKPIRLDKPLSFRFYLLANPFKPLPKDWRTWYVYFEALDQVGWKTKHTFWYHWNEYAKSYVPYPGGVAGKTYGDWLGAFKKTSIYHVPMINFGVAAGSPLYNVHYEEMIMKPFTWKLHTNRMLQDWQAYWLNKTF